jgi:hypothetical protein
MSRCSENLPFRIELWDDADTRIEEVIALTADFASACGAYEEAVKPAGEANYAPAEGAGYKKKSLTVMVVHSPIS